MSVNLIIGKSNKLCQFDYWTLNCSNGKLRTKLALALKLNNDGCKNYSYFRANLIIGH